MARRVHPPMVLRRCRARAFELELAIGAAKEAHPRWGELQNLKALVERGMQNFVNRVNNKNLARCG